jgi:hypothetical protein
MIGPINTINGLDYAFGEMVVGVASIVLPSHLYSFQDFSKDHILEIQRRTEGGEFRTVGNRVWFVRGKKQNSKVLTLKAYDTNYLLTGRIVAYAAKSSYASKSGAADNLIKAIIRENLGSSATDTARRITGLTIKADNSLGASVSAEFSRDIVLKACQKLANMSIQAGTYITFDFNYLGGTAFEFDTFKGQRGQDHGSTSSEKRVFSEKFKNLIETEIEEDNKDEATVVYAGGTGEEENRAIGTASTSGATATIFGRRELFWDGKRTANVDVLIDEAEAQLWENRAKKVFSGRVQEAEGTRFGIDYDYGDIVIIEGYGVTSNARISTVHISVNEQGKEDIDIKLRGEWA